MTRGALLALGLLAACRRDNAAGVADRFVRLYLVEASQSDAMELAAGPAREKLAEELRLVEDIRRGGYTPAHARGRVSFRRVGERVEGGRARVEYEVTVRSGDVESRRRALIVLREGDGWRVSNFEVTEGPAPE